MLSQEELNALLQLLNKTPMTPAELLWVKTLIAKLTPQEKPDAQT